MALPNLYNKAIKENINVDLSTRHSPQKVIFCNPENEYYGNFRGSAEIFGLSVVGGSLSGMEISGSNLYDSDGKLVDLDRVVSSLADVKESMNSICSETLPGFKRTIDSISSLVDNLDMEKTVDSGLVISKIAQQNGLVSIETRPAATKDVSSVALLTCDLFKCNPNSRILFDYDSDTRQIKFGHVKFPQRLFTVDCDAFLKNSTLSTISVDNSNPSDKQLVFISYDGGVVSSISVSINNMLSGMLSGDDYIKVVDDFALSLDFNKLKGEMTGNLDGRINTVSVGLSGLCSYVQDIILTSETEIEPAKLISSITQKNGKVIVGVRDVSKADISAVSLTEDDFVLQNLQRKIDFRFDNSGNSLLLGNHSDYATGNYSRMLCVDCSKFIPEGGNRAFLMKYKNEIDDEQLKKLSTNTVIDYFKNAGLLDNDTIDNNLFIPVRLSGGNGPFQTTDETNPLIVGNGDIVLIHSDDKYETLEISSLSVGYNVFVMKAGVSRYEFTQGKGDTERISGWIDSNFAEFPNGLSTTLSIRNNVEISGNLDAVSAKIDYLTPKNLSTETISLTGEGTTSVITQIKETDGVISLTAGELTEDKVTNLCSDLSALNEDIHQKIWLENKVDGIDGEYSDLSVVKVTKDEYEALESWNPRTVYVVDDEYQDMYGAQIKNLADGTDISDAINLGQLLSVSSVLENKISTKIWIENPSQNISAYHDLSVVKLPVQEYEKLAPDGYNPYTIYVVSSDHFDACSSTIQNVADAVDNMDAVNLKQLNLVEDRIDSDVAAIDKRVEDLSSVDDFLSAEIRRKVFFNDTIHGTSGYNNLSVMKLTRNEYQYYHEHGMLSSELSNVIFFVDDDAIDAFGQKIVNVKNGRDDTDAVNVGQLSELSSRMYDSIQAKIESLDLDIVSLTSESGVVCVLTSIGEEDGIVSIGTSPLQQNMVSNLTGDLENLNNKISTKIWLENEQGGITGEYSDLSVVKISKKDYEALESWDPRTVYVVYGNFQDMYGAQIKNLADGTEVSDAVNLSQLSSVEHDAQSKINVLRNALRNALSAYKDVIATNFNSLTLDQMRLMLSAIFVTFGGYEPKDEPTGMFRTINSNLENFNDQDITSLTGEITSSDIVSGKLPAPGSFIPVKYKISSDSFVDTQFQVLGYNGSIPEYVKYKNEDGGLVYVKSIGEGGFLSSIVNGVSAFSDKNGSGYIGLVDNVSEETFRYGQTNPDWGISATDSGSYDVPMNLTVDNVNYTFAGYNMTIMSRYGLRTSVDGTAYNRICFSKNGSSLMNRWTTSEIRSWMNGSGSETGATWYPESGSTTSTSVPGLLDRFEPDMLGSVSKAVNRTFVYGGSVDHAVDTFWLPGWSNINDTESVYFPDCKNDTCKFSTAFKTTNASRIRYFMSDTGESSGTACYWWLRSAHSGHNNYVGGVYNYGYVGYYSANSNYAVLPVCLIG